MTRRQLTVAAILALAASVGLPGRARSGDAPTQVVRIVAERFTFAPSQVRVKRGTRVEFRLTSGDTNHGFRILGTKVSVVVPKRGRGDAVAVFDATHAGRYVFECSKPCGAGHSIMRGEIIVE